MSDNPKLDSALAEILPHLRDVSLRDGIQSWDGNRWRIDDIVPVAQEINTLAQVAKRELGVNMAPAEVWGGGQVLQPALFLKEDPFQNLDRLNEALPDVQMQCLYRGRQAFGFSPVSDEVQKAAIEETAARGMKVFRIFDMMNDPANVDTGIRTLVEYKNAHPDSGVKIEGAISYISEPPGDKRAWTLDEYGDYAVQLAKKGCDELAIKNYAGVNDAEMAPLAEAIHRKLVEASKEPGWEHLADMKINLHSHGQKPALFAGMLKDGIVDKVDVAIGELSGGPAHTNMRDVITQMLEAKGFTREAIDAHPVMQQLATVEESISNVVHRPQEIAGQETTFYDRRGELKKLKQEDVERYRLAQGSFSDVVNRVDTLKLPTEEQRRKAFYDILDEIPPLWEKAGRFNSVTPGAKILVAQAVNLYLADIMKRPRSMENYTDDYIKVATGRFGANHGAEKGIGDSFADALMMYKALKVLNKGSANREIDPLKYQTIISITGFGGPGQRPRMRNGNVDLADPNLESVLMVNPKGTLKRFHEVIEKTVLPKELKAALLAELNPVPSRPKEGLAEGKAIIDGMQKRDDAEVPTYAPLLAMLLRDHSNGDPDKIIKGLYGVPAQTRAATMRSTPPETDSVAMRA